MEEASRIMQASDLIPWGIVALTATAQIIETLRSAKAHKAEIEAKNAQLEILREFTSEKVRDHLVATKAVLEESIENLQRQLVTKDQEIAALKNGHISKTDVLVDAVTSVEQLKEAQQKLDLQAMVIMEFLERLKKPSVLLGD